MTYERLQQLRPSAFKRRCGVQRETFSEMVRVLRPDLDRPGKQCGQGKLSVEDQLLVALEYWREYHSLFPIAESWDINESSVCQIVQKVETLLLQSGKFRLPGKKQVYENAYEWGVVLIDGAETPIERPQKNNASITVARKTSYSQSPASGRSSGCAIGKCG